MKERNEHLKYLTISLWLAFFFFTSSMAHLALVEKKTDYALLMGLVGIGLVLGIISFELALIAHNLSKPRK